MEAEANIDVDSHSSRFQPLIVLTLPSQLGSFDAAIHDCQRDNIAEGEHP
jgi:hypothetical protein